jgi:hypothetical protein
VSEPLEEQALVAVVELLKGMNDVRPWGGAYPSPPRVERELPMSAAAIGQCPLLVVSFATDGTSYELGEAIEGMTSVGGGLGYKNLLSFDVIGYVQGSGEVLADTWALRLRRDVLETLCARAEVLPSVPQARSIWPTGAAEFDPGILGEHMRAFGQHFTVIIDDVIMLS